MHYSNLVIFESEADPKTDVDAVMQKGKDDWWDFYQIGGRWTGFFDGYDPTKDPLLTEVCWLCNGTGKRQDMTCLNGCNGCQGGGRMRQWSTQWPFREADIIPVEALTQEHVDKVYRVVAYKSWGGEVYMPWREEVFMELPKPPASWLRKEYAGCRVAIVDNHD